MTSMTIPTTGPKRFLLIASVFVVVFVVVWLGVPPINRLDYDIQIQGLREVWAGRNPYIVEGYFTPPWAIPVVAPLVSLSLNTWLALSLALFVAACVDLGTPWSLFLLMHPILITLIASSNPEWLWVGPGLWLLYRQPRGIGRGIAWVLLAAKPQTTAVLLLFDGVVALRHRDWRAVGAAAVLVLPSLIFLPLFWESFKVRLEIEWSGTVFFHYGVLGALAVTLIILALRYRRLHDYKTLAILLNPVWTPYLLQYGYMAVLFTMRRGNWWQVVLYVASGILLTVLFWQDYHVNEQLGLLGMVLFAAWLAPADPQPGAETAGTTEIESVNVTSEHALASE